MKLIEYGSYTCPHCAVFAKESEAELKGKMIRSGGLSLEYRHLIRDPADLAPRSSPAAQGPAVSRARMR